MSEKNQSKKSAISNTEFLLLGLLLAGGAEKYVDIEHVAVMCNAIAPTQFRWRLFDYPSLEAVQRGVGDLRKVYGDSVIRKPKGNSTERMLTATGIEQAMIVAERLTGQHFENPRDVLKLYPKSVDRPESNKMDQRVSSGRPAQRELRKMRNHRVFQIWESGSPLSSVERWEFADLLSCLPDSTPEIWTERLERLKALASWWQDSEIVSFLRDVETTLAASAGDLV